MATRLYFYAPSGRAVAWLCLIGLLLDRRCATAQPADYLYPTNLIGIIYPIGSSPAKMLFKSQRRSAAQGVRVEASCDYTYPDGKLAARDRMVYQDGQLVSIDEALFQTGDRGSAVIRPDPRKPGQRRIFFEYSTGEGSERSISTDSEALAPDTLIDDMLPGFMVSHWTQIENGGAAKFRFIVLSRKETVGFKLVADGAVSWHGQPALRIKMIPTSFIIAQLVDPLVFVVERGAPHRILEYTGRMTPLIKNGTKWKDLDAVCVFDWGTPPRAGAAANPGR